MNELSSGDSRIERTALRSNTTLTSEPSVWS